ncbi:hypothetical protein DPMN_108071 [Dreissena polymorpha]|uniref:Uncharacterized protein n=1 Tax=Dreissena polymorpha TaxID=45954 RepID=A0A9D4QKK4_DREPO|nr:hypothetical protein DPMN_108071 [Dreissena polymorpha]
MTTENLLQSWSLHDGLLRHIKAKDCWKQGKLSDSLKDLQRTANVAQRADMYIRVIDNMMKKILDLEL